MQTSIPAHIKNTPEGQEAEAILRSCVHCGFCLATCPTYQLLGNELDSPRGRIYLIKQVLEGADVGDKTLLHLDRCLTCRSCETTCPSGVQYGRLVDIGRNMVENQVVRPWQERLVRWGLRAVIPYRRRFTPLLRLGQAVRSLLPPSIRLSIPPRQATYPWPTTAHRRRMLVLEGCAQPAAAPRINAATARVLDRLGIAAIRAPEEGCCGAVSYHLGAQDEGLGFMRRNIDAWWPLVASGAEAIVMTASGCGAVVKEYGHLLRHDQNYAEKATKISAITKDLCEILKKEDVSGLSVGDTKVAFHPPCTLQHAQQLQGIVENMLRTLGFTLTSVPDAHLCCGSAGTYSILQKKLSQPLLQEKIKALESNHPDLIATANIGCLLHLQTATNIPVKHWIELLE